MLEGSHESTPETAWPRESKQPTQPAAAPGHRGLQHLGLGRPQVSTYVAQLMLDTSASRSRGCETVSAPARWEGSYSLRACLVS